MLQAGDWWRCLRPIGLSDRENAEAVDGQLLGPPPGNVDDGWTVGQQRCSQDDLGRPLTDDADAPVGSTMHCDHPFSVAVERKLSYAGSSLFSVDCARRTLLAAVSSAASVGSPTAVH